MTMLSENVLSTFHDSFDRCRDNPRFFDLFYERFLQSSDEIEVIFNGVDIERVKKMVRDALLFILIASDGSSHGIQRINNLGRAHREWRIENHHYDLWLESLMSTVEEIDPLYSQNVDSAWREVMSIGIHIMKRNT